jgi:hypothetical protein
VNAILLLVALAAVAAPGSRPESSCISCHRELDGDLAAPVDGWETDVHAGQGLGCVGCHGGNPASAVADDPEAAMDPAEGYVGRPDRARVAEFCGRCHSSAGFMRRFNPAARIDQVAEYRNSRHGVLNRDGDLKTATCTDCHSVHGILPVTHPNSPVHAQRVADTCGRCHADAGYMEGRGLETGQLDEFRSSVHGVALLERRDSAAPACNDCHGNHGAVPPGVTNIAFVCGQCHARVGTLFRDSPKKAIFDDLEFAECSTCHGTHAIREPGDFMVGLGPESTCTECHEADDDGGQTADGFRTAFDDLSGRIERAETILHRAERAGMEVSQELFDLQEARNSLVNGRVLVHAFDLDRVAETTTVGLTVADKAFAEGEEAIGELQFRRLGLASSLIVILMVMLGLAWKIRQIGMPGEDGSRIGRP